MPINFMKLLQHFAGVASHICKTWVAVNECWEKKSFDLLAASICDDCHRPSSTGSRTMQIAFDYACAYLALGAISFIFSSCPLIYSTLQPAVFF